MLSFIRCTDHAKTVLETSDNTAIDDALNGRLFTQLREKSSGVDQIASNVEQVGNTLLPFHLSGQSKNSRRLLIENRMVFDRLIYLNPGSEALLKQLKSDCQGIKVQQRNGSDQLVFKFNNPESQTAFNAFLASIPIGYTPLDSNIEPDDQTLTINIMASKNLLGCQTDSFGVAYEPLPQHMSFAEMRRQTDRDIRNLFDTMGVTFLFSLGPLPMQKFLSKKIYLN